jgi:DNA-binding protein HU-beta
VIQLNKGDLVRAVAEQTGFTRRDAGEAVDAIFGAIAEALARGDKVSLVGFGGFEVRERAPRMGRNPQTGKAVRIKARKAPAFRPGKPLREAVNG